MLQIFYNFHEYIYFRFNCVSEKNCAMHQENICISAISKQKTDADWVGGRCSSVFFYQELFQMQSLCVLMNTR